MKLLPEKREVNFSTPLILPAKVKANECKLNFMFVSIKIMKNIVFVSFLIFIKVFKKIS